VVTVLDHPVPPQEFAEHVRIRLPGREVRRRVADSRRFLHHLAPPQFLHVTRDLDHLVEVGKLRVPVQYLTRADGALGQTAVAFVDGVALVGDGSAGLEAQLRLFEEVRHVFLIFTR